MSAPSVLDFQGISRAYVRNKPVLDDVSFSVHGEEVVALLGRNGTGKTTLIHIAMGMLFPHSGTVRVFGLSPTDQPVAVKKRIGYVAEDQVLPSGSSVAELLAFHRFLYKSWDIALEKQLLDRFGLGGKRLQLKIAALSKGQARQVALVCAVCHRPELLILDEPAGGLDPAARREFLETSIQVLNREGSAILFSSHHMGDVERLGGRVVLLEAGKVRLDHELDQLRENHCVAIIPGFVAVDADTIMRVPGCLQARMSHGDWHAVFQGTPADTQGNLHAALGINEARCASVPLEELFVELVGGKPMAEAL